MVGVQQSLRERVIIRLTHLIDKALEQESPESILSRFRIKLSGYGTQIARGLSVVIFNSTVLEEGQNSSLFCIW